MQPLYEIDRRLRIALDEAYSTAAENDGEIPEGLANTIDGLEMAREIKIGNVAMAYKNTLAEADAVAAEAQNLTKRARSLKNRAEWLKAYLDTSLSYEPFKDAKTVISWRGSLAVKIADTASFDRVPVNWIKTEMSWVKAEIKADLEKGIKMDGFSIEVNRNIQIK